ncbi:MAG: hypothetical protein DWG76_05845 [Chloroflexi bacterium]|nr:hypothetical protein [Chloroflexota bacterium]
MLMGRLRSPNFAEILLPISILVLLAAYTYAGLVLFPYLGFQFGRTSGEINDVFVAEGGLRLGDRIISSEDLGWEAYQANLHEPLHPEARFMESVQIEIERGGASQLVEWAMPGFTNAEFGSRLLSIWPYGFVFWLAGTLTLLLVRPRSHHRSLLAAFFYITAIWLVAGNFSRMHVLESAFVMRAALWMTLPIYLHFHWNFPQRMGKAPAWTWPVLYGAGVLGAALQWTDVLSHEVYAVPFGLAVLGCASILLFRYARRPAERRETRLLLAAALIALFPALLTAVAANLGLPMPFGLQLALYSLIALPGAYFYVIYRRQLGGLEFRANRVISIYLYLLILLLALLLLIPAFNTSIRFPEAELGIVIGAVLFTALVTVFGFGRFQRFVERRLLNMPLPPEHLLTSFAGKIATSLTIENLLQVLDEEILPSLLIRQSALISCGEDNHVHVLIEQGLNPKQVPDRAQIDKLLKQANGAAKAPKLQVRGRTLSWVRMAFAIMAGEKAIGLWLLGERDPDDYYSQAEAVLLASLADQMAIALANIAQATRLRALYQLDIDQQENERARLALELHDDALNRFAELKTLVVEK